MQGKAKPVHVSFHQKCTARQQRIGKGNSQRKGETENIGTVQNGESGKELRKDQIRYRYYNQKWHGRLGRPSSYC